MGPEFFDPEQEAWGESLRRDLLTCIADVAPEVLQGLPDDVLPSYCDLVTDARSKEVQRLFTVASEPVTTGAKNSGESPSAILESLTSVLPTVEGLEPFRAALCSWCVNWYLDAGAWEHDAAMYRLHDAALYRLTAWIRHPETEKLSPVPDEDCSWWPKLKAKRRKRIANIKKKRTRKGATGHTIESNTASSKKS